MNAERLLKLADHLETVVAKQPAGFDMDAFGTVTHCGTVCCALGHACSIPEFKEDGLRLEWERAAGEQFATVCLERDGDQTDMTDFEAAQRFFDLEEHHVFDLFGPGYGEPKATPIGVAARIRRFVADHRADDAAAV